MNFQYGSVLNPFSLLLTVFVLSLVFWHRKLTYKYCLLVSVTVFVEIFIEQGYYINISGKVLSYDDFCHYALLLFSTVLLIKYRHIIPRNIVNWSCLLIVSSVLTVAVQLVYPFKGALITNWDLFFYGVTASLHKFDIFAYIMPYLYRILPCLIGFIIANIIIKKVIGLIGLITVIKILRRFLDVYICFLILELVSKNLFHYDGIDDFYAFFFGVRPATYSGFVERLDGVYSIWGWSTEPAHLVYGMLVFMIIDCAGSFVIKGRIGISSKIKIFIISCIMFISGSFSSFLYLATFVVFIYYIICYVHNKERIFYMTLSIIVLIAILSLGTLIAIAGGDGYFSSRVLEVSTTLNALTTGEYGSARISSSTVRIFSMVVMFGYFMDNPILGYGSKIIYADDGVVSVLFTYGLLGLFIIIKLLLFGNKYSYGALVIIVLFSQVLNGDPEFITQIYSIIVCECLRENYIKRDANIQHSYLTT